MGLKPKKIGHVDGVIVHSMYNTCSDGRVVRASASGAVDLIKFDSTLVQTNDFKIDIHSFPA